MRIITSYIIVYEENKTMLYKTLSGIYYLEIWTDSIRDFKKISQEEANKIINDSKIL